ncbi:MAG: peptidylprolyl isomerase [Armatimonadota bacterium]
MLNRKIILMAMALLTSTGAWAAPVAKVAATVNGTPITQAALDAAVADWYSPMGLEELIVTRLVGEEAKKAGVVVTEADVKARMQQFVERSKARGMSFEESVLRSGRTISYAYAMIKMQLQAEEVLKKQIKITDQDIDNARRARHILIQYEGNPTSPEEQAQMEQKAEEQVKKIAEEIQNGLPFEEAAKKYSEDPGSKADGGDLGWFGRGFTVPEFENVAFGLEPGKISEPIKTSYGYHIIRVDAIGKDAKPEVRKEIYDALFETRMARINVGQWISELRDKAQIKSSLIPPKPKPATLPQGMGPQAPGN